MKSERPWGWGLFLFLDILALVFWPMVRFVIELISPDFETLSWAALVQLMRLPALSCAALIAVVGLISRRGWGRWLLLAATTLNYGLELLLIGLMFKMGFFNILSGGYLLMRPLLLLGAHWVYLNHHQVRRYLL
jgi:hypothetical protein